MHKLGFIQVSVDRSKLISKVVNCLEVDVLKKKVTTDGFIKSCITYEDLFMLVWKARTMALILEPDQKILAIIGLDRGSNASCPFPPATLEMPSSSLTP